MAVTVSNTSASLSGKTLLKAEDAQTITGAKTFNLGASAPFIVTAGAAVVANLDSDKLDGQHGAFYQDASNLNAGTVPVARVVAADPNADRVVFWDDSAGALAFLELIGLAIRGTKLVLAPSVPNGRLSLTSGNPTPSADVTAATTLYYALYGGNKVPLYNSAAWENFVIAELSLAVPASTNQMYDLFVDYNSGAPQLVALAWTNDTTRATALTAQDGVLVKTGATGQLFIGAFRTTGVSGQTEDSVARRLLYNYYHRQERVLQRFETNSSWAYTVATVRQARASALNQVDCVVGIAGSAVVDLINEVTAVNDTGNGTVIGIGEDSTTTQTVASWAQASCVLNARLVKYVPLGYHYYSWNESSIAAGVSTFYGATAIGGSSVQGGMRGFVTG